MDTIVKEPPHYTRYEIEPIEFIMRNDLPFYLGNIVKYALRAGHKMYPNMNIIQSEVTDLQKVMRYCEMRINQINNEELL